MLMRRLFLLLLFAFPAICMAQSRSLSVDDLLTLSSLAPKNFDGYMVKKGFSPGGRRLCDDVMATTFFEKKNNKNQDSVSITRSIDVYKKGDTHCFALHTSSVEEYGEGKNLLKKAGFFYDNTKDVNQPAVSLTFQKGSIRVISKPSMNDDSIVYSFVLEKKEFPDPGNVRFAEDLLKFDSHEHLVSFFGEENVKKDIYYFSEKESTKCSVLFPNSNRQAVFIWEDEANLFKISFVLISGTISTASAVHFSGNFSQNTWESKNGIYSGMRLKDLLKLNVNDFKFYGRGSEFAFMVVPEKTRYIDFTKIGVMLGCFECNASGLLDSAKISAADAVDYDLALYVSCIMIKP